MIKTHQSYDTSSELLVQRWGNGIKLIKPQDNRVRLKTFTIGQIFSSHLHAFFLDTQSVIQNINEATVKNCGFHSIKSAIGHTVAIAAKKETAEFEFLHDREVIAAQQMILKEETYLGLQDSEFTAINIKYPWYNHDNKLIGIFGFSFPINSNLPGFENSDLLSPLGYILSSLIHAGLLGMGQKIDYISNIVPGIMIDSVYLSKRSADVLRLLVQGKTAKESAKILNLSHRTIEDHLVKMKSKLKVNTKSQLIEKVIDNLAKN